MAIVLYPIEDVRVEIDAYTRLPYGKGYLELRIMGRQGPRTVVLHSQTPESLERLSDKLRAAALDLRQKIEAVRMADPKYIPTVVEALRNPAEFVAGMVEEPAVIRHGLPPHLRPASEGIDLDDFDLDDFDLGGEAGELETGLCWRRADPWD